MPHPIEIPVAARQALSEGRKIEAIKIVREELGLGLAEAKTLVEQAEQGTDLPAQEAEPSAPETLPLAAVVALRKGNKIEAIKVVREAFGLGLKDAKERVEFAVERNPMLRAELEGAVKRARPTAFLSILVLVIVAGLAVYLLTR